LDGISRLNFLERLVLPRKRSWGSLPTKLGSLDSLEYSGNAQPEWMQKFKQIVLKGEKRVVLGGADPNVLKDDGHCCCVDDSKEQKDVLWQRRAGCLQVVFESNQLYKNKIEIVYSLT
jgi:hypothetical protein